MIFIGKAVEENKDFNYAGETISKAREKIKEYAYLNSILDNFKESNKDNYNKNYLLLLSRNALSSPFLGWKPDKNAEEKLKCYEKLLSSMIPKLNKESREKLISRIKGFGENHFKTITELELLQELLNNNQISNLEYENQSKGNQDFNFFIGNDEFNLELTSLGEGEIQKILEDAFNASASEILNLIPEYTLLKLNVTTDMILKEGNNNVNDIKNCLIDSFRRIAPIITIVKNDHCILERNFGDSEVSLIEKMDLFRHYGEFGSRLSKLTETKEGVEFLKTTKIKDIESSPFFSFIFGDAKARLVEIHSECFWPSKAELLRKKSMLRQFVKNIEYKIKKGQLKGKANPIIVFNFSDDAFHDYTSNDIYDQEQYEELKGIVEHIFKELNEKEILGVLLYDSSLKNSKFIKNPIVNIEDNIITKIQMLSE